MDNKKLTAENVHSTFIECLSKKGEQSIEAHGVMLLARFHPDRIKSKENIIAEMLNGLSDDFKKDEGGGMSFLNMCNDKDDIQWADLHQTMDELVCLGIASNKMSFLMPRDLWNIMPGGMPYLVVN